MQRPDGYPSWASLWGNLLRESCCFVIVIAGLFGMLVLGYLIVGTLWM